MANGTLVEGFVVNRDGQSNPILRTPLGDLKVTSEVFLKTGSEVVFRVDTSHASLARIVSVDGLTPQDYNTQNTSRSLTSDTITQTAIPNTHLLSQAAQTGKAPAGAPLLQAFVLQSFGQQAAATPAHAPQSLFGLPSAPLPLLAQLAQLRPGASLRLAVLDVKMPPQAIPLHQLPESSKLDALLPPKPSPQGVVIPSPPAQDKPIQQAASPATGAIGQATANPVADKPVALNLPPMLQSNQAASSASAPVREAPHHATPPQPNATATTQTPASPHAETRQPYINRHAVQAYGGSTHPPATRAQTVLAPTTAQQPSQALPTNAVQAEIIGHDADGANILHTPVASLKIYTPQPLPVGSSLVVMMPEGEVITDAPPAPAASPTTLLSSGGFLPKLDSFEDALTFLKTTASPDIAQEALQKLPTDAGHRLSHGMLHLFSALKSGDVSELFGKRAWRVLEAGSPALASKLRAQFDQIQISHLDSPMQQWSLLPLPILMGQDVLHTKLFISKDPDPDENSNTNAHGQRFVLEVGLSELGDMQLDGFVRTHEAGKSFDLAIRSGKPLDAQVTQDIREIFATSLAVTGLRGQVSFQTGSEHFFRPPEVIKTASGGENPHTILA